ncbi:envelope stress response protein PspG [Shigella flexneri]
MLELLFVIGFFMLMVTGVSLLGILAALVVATVVMFVGGLFALTIKLLPWLLWPLRWLGHRRLNRQTCRYQRYATAITKVLRVCHNLTFCRNP